MAYRRMNTVVRRIERLFAAGTVAGLTEGQLLERFATAGDEAAFEALVARHGPMVLGVCRQLLVEPADVEDAFQATFLVLVRKAGTLRDCERVGNWLFGVALRVAHRARALAARRRAVEAGGDCLDAPDSGLEPIDRAAGKRETWAVLHEEVRRLPEKIRTAVLLCDLEGLTHEEAARQLGWPLGTVKGRLARSRELLRARLTRRGVALSSSAIALALPRLAEAVPAALAASTCQAAAHLAAGRAAAAVMVGTNVAALMKGASHAMVPNALKLVVMVFVAGLLATGAGVIAFPGNGPDAAPAPAPPRRVAAGPPAGAAAPSNHDVDVLRDAAERMFDSQWDAYTKGRVSVDRIAEASRRWLEAELAPAGGAAADRSAAYRAHLKRMEKLEAYEHAALPRHQGSDENFTAARFLRLQAEQMLAGAGGQDLPPPVMVSSIPTPTPNPSPPVIEGPPVAAAFAAAPAGAGLEGAGEERPAQSKAAAERVDRIAIARLAPRVAASDRTPATQAVLTLLEKPVPLAYGTETPLQAMLDAIRAETKGPESSGLPIFLDPVGLARAGKTGASPVRLVLPPGVPLKTSLRLLLKQLNLAYCVRDGLVIVSSVDEVLQELKEAEAGEGRAEPAGEEVAVGATMPAPPGEPAGAGTVAVESKPDVGQTRSQALQLRLDRPVALSFPKPTPLEDVFGALKKTAQAVDGAGLPIYISPGVREKLQSLVELDLPGVSLRTTLTLLLQQVELEWIVQDGLLIVGTREDINTIQRITSHFTTVFGIALDSMFSAPVGDIAIEETFARPVGLNFPEETPLAEVIKAIRQKMRRPDGKEFPIYLGRGLGFYTSLPGGASAVYEEKAIGSLPVRIDVTDVPLRTCLAILLAQHQLGNHPEGGTSGLDGRILDGVLVLGNSTWLQSLHIPGGPLEAGSVGPSINGSLPPVRETEPNIAK